MYLKDETTHAFCALKEFLDYCHQDDVSYSKFILSYNQRNAEVKKYDLTVVDGVQSYFLLVVLNLSLEHFWSSASECVW